MGEKSKWRRNNTQSNCTRVKMVFAQQFRQLKRINWTNRLKFFTVLGLICFVSLVIHGNVLQFLGSLFSGPEIPVIFFVKTSGGMTLTLREACALESAVLHHPHRPVQVYTISPLAPSHPNIQELFETHNIGVKMLNLEELFYGTPLQKWYESGLYKESEYPVQHMSDAVRLAILWQQGGTYLDTDIIVLKPLDLFHNALGWGLNKTAGNSALMFEKEHKFIYNCMVEFTRKYSLTSYDNQGPILMTRTLRRTCGIVKGSFDDVIGRPNKCQGVTVLPQYTFYAYDWNHWEKLFGSKEEVDIARCYGVHIYAKMTKRVKGTFGTDSLLEHLATQNCPITYKQMVKLGKL